MGKSLRSQDKKSWQIFIVIYITVFTVFTLIPLYLTIINALKDNASVAGNIFGFPSFWKQGFFSTIGRNFSLAWSGPGLIDGMNVYFWRSVLLAFASAFLTCVIGTILGYLFTYKTFYFKEGIFIFFLAVMMLPSIMGMPVLVPFVSNTLGLKDSYVGYLLPILSGGQVTSLFLFRTFFSQQPKAIYESARIEGANDMQLYLTFTVPLALPIILYCFVGSVSSVYNDYLWPILILRDNLTLMPAMKNLETNFVNDKGAIYAMYILSSIPLIITSIISMKFFGSGDFAAGLKL